MIKMCNMLATYLKYVSWSGYLLEIGSHSLINWRLFSFVPLPHPFSVHICLTSMIQIFKQNVMLHHHSWPTSFNSATLEGFRAGTACWRSSVSWFHEVPDDMIEVQALTRPFQNLFFFFAGYKLMAKHCASGFLSRVLNSGFNHFIRNFLTFFPLLINKQTTNCILYFLWIFLCNIKKMFDIDHKTPLHARHF